MDPARVSIVMLTFNRPQYISRAVESIRRQSISDWELIVIHDGPNQKIETILREWEAREPRVRYFRRSQWGNIAEATNFGIRQARSQYIAILDDDDYWRSSDKLARQILFLEEHPDYVACGGGAVCVGENDCELMAYLKPQEDGQIKKRALLANPMIHSTTLYRKDAAEKVGLYDETLAGFQDWDFFLKLGHTGKLYNFAEHFLAYQIWEGGGSFEAQKRNTESALRIVRRHGKHYSAYPLALAMAYSYCAYALLPLRFRRWSFSRLSRLKKALFSDRK
jgi:glycosyltransferase involved in cell wall biosynthesis